MKANPETKNNENDDDLLLKRGMLGFRFIIGMALIALVLYFIKFGTNGWAEKQDVWGQFGDYMGGVLNPFIGLVTVYLILVNVRLQKKELGAALKEMKNSNDALTVQNASIVRQNFEQTFFAWLSSYRNLVSSVGYTAINTQETFSGRDALYQLWKDYLGPDSIARHLVGRPINPPLNPGTEYMNFLNNAVVPLEKKGMVEETLLYAWEQAYQKSEHHIDSMFRTLYRLILWIDEQSEAVLSQEEKMRYVSIIRSQISHIEMVFLFFNGFTARGMNFNRLINHYAILDNLDPKDDASIQYLMTSDRLPFAQSAFSSSEARKAHNL